MNWLDELPLIAREAVASPKVLATVATTTATIGGASAAELIHGFFSGLAMVVGVVATILLSRNHFIDFRNKKLQNKILRKQVTDLGLDPDTE